MNTSSGGRRLQDRAIAVVLHGNGLVPSVRPTTASHVLPSYPNPTRAYLRRRLEAHVAELGYSCIHATPAGERVPEIVRVSPTRGSIAYGETVLRSDLRRKSCHDRLVLFSQRRTRWRSSILFFIGVAADDQDDLEALLSELDIRKGVRGGHVHVVPVAGPRNRSRA